MKPSSILIVSAAALSVAACAQPTTRDGYIASGVSAASGAAIGGYVGSLYGGGSGQLVFALFGAAIGGMGGWAYGSTLMPSDRSAFRQTANSALDYSPKGQVVSWVNPETRVAGTITPGDNFTGRGGARCREFDVSVAAPEGIGRGSGTACRTEAGDWQLYNSPV